MYICIIQSFPYESHCTANVTKSKYQDQDCGQCYLQLRIFFLYIHPPLLLKNKKLL